MIAEEKGGLVKKNCILVYLSHIKKINNCCQLYIAGYKQLFAWPILVCLAFAAVFLSVVPSEAGMVYGHVSLDGGTFPPQGRLTFLKTDQNGDQFIIMTDQNGNYNAFFPRGVYRVEFTQEGEKDTTIWSAKFRSYTNPIKQDIHMTIKDSE